MMIHVLLSVNAHCNSHLDFSVKIEDLPEVVVSVNEASASNFKLYDLCSKMTVQQRFFMSV